MPPQVTVPPGPFHSAMSLVLRACVHIEDLEKRLQEFLNERPWEYVIEFDPETGKDAHKFRYTKPIPSDIPPIARDAIINLRDALDHMMYASAVALNGGDPENTKFPFSKTLNDLEKEIVGKKRSDVPWEILTVAKRFRPYREGDGDEGLHALNELRNVKVHRTIRPFATRASTVHVQGAYFKGTGINLGTTWNGDKNELTYMRTTYGAERATYRYVDITPVIVLSEEPPLNRSGLHSPPLAA